MSFLMKQAGTWHALSAKSGDMCLNAGGTADNVIIRPGMLETAFRGRFFNE